MAGPSKPICQSLSGCRPPPLATANYNERARLQHHRMRHKPISAQVHADYRLHRTSSNESRQKYGRTLGSTGLSLALSFQSIGTGGPLGEREKGTTCRTTRL